MAGETILIVDDGRDNREFIIEYVLAPNGYKALTAKDGIEGLEVMVKHKPDLILLDFNMPRLDGSGVLQKMVEHQINIPVILMTFYGSEEIAIEVYRLGVRDYVKKPFSVDEMEMAIDKSLTETRLRREKEALTERVIQANRELQLRLQELNVLYGVGKSVTSILNMERLLPRIVDASIKLTRAEQGHIFLVEEGNSLICRAQRQIHSTQAVMYNNETRNAVALQVMRSAEPILNSQEKPYSNKSMPLSIAYVPLMLQNRVIGIIGVDNFSPKAGQFTQHDIALLSALGDYATIAITNAHNYDALKQTEG